MAESVTNTGNIVGRVDQHMGKNESPSGYKYQYVNVDKNKKLGLIHKGNVNAILYNLLWDIVSHQVDNETAKGEMKEVNWLLKRFPKDEDRDDDTGVSNETIHKYVDKARDIVRNMKETVSEEVYVSNGRITKRPSDKGKKLSEEVDEEMNEERTPDSVYKIIKNGLIDGDNPEEDIRKYINHCAEKKYITKEQKESLIKYLEAREKYGSPSDEDKLNEDSIVGKYSIKKIKENGVEKYGVYDQSGNLRATYPDEQTAKDAVQGKKVFEEKSSKMNEEYNPFKDLKKVKDKEYRKGLYTDGNGYYYEVPKTGASKWVKKKNYKFRYNFEKREVEVADNAGDVIYTSGLSVGNWLDGPDYWYDKVFKDMEDEDDAWIEEYFRQHPEVDKRNISVEHLKEDKTDGGECDNSKKLEKSIRKLKDNKVHIAEQELDEADETVKFSSVDELSKYLSDKDSVIIYYDGKQYQILDEDIEDEEGSDES